MNNFTRITEIDISKPARALAWLRLTDYALVVVCGSGAIGMLAQLVDSSSNDTGAQVFGLIALVIFCFAAYTGWRHVGVIDPAVWSAYRVVFPLLMTFCLFIVWSDLATIGSAAKVLELDRVEFIQELSGLLNSVWIGSVALLGWISLTLLRKMKLNEMGVTVGQVLLRLAKNAGVNAVQATSIKRINKPRGLAIGAAGAFVLLAMYLPPVLAPAQLLALLLGFFLLIRARRYFQIDADSLLAVDRRPPILFLRSFDDDEKLTYRGPNRALLDFSLETRLSNHFSKFGPFIAIGSPKETVPQIGAARVLLSNDEWQPRVLHWMRDAALIIMYSGKTQWVNWELRKTIENACVTRLILMIPEIKAWRRSKRNKEISARVQQVRQVFKSTPWEEELEQFDDFARVRAMLFRPDGSMVMIKSRSRSRDSYHLAALVGHQILIDGDALSQEDADVRTAHAHV
jgi:hypothetical protein